MEPRRLYKCFQCGKMYESEEAALACHNAPIQRVLERDIGRKPKFQGA